MRIPLSIFIFIFIIATSLYGQGNQSMDSITKLLEKIYYEDQVPRQEAISLEKQFGWNSDEVRNKWELINYQDSINTNIVTQIIDKYGWLGANQTSDTANRALFMVIQHAQKETRIKYIETLKNAVHTGKLEPARYALFLDRTNTDVGKLQEYGSQLFGNGAGKYYFFPIRDEPNVNKRRQKIGMTTLEEYAKLFNFSYSLPKEDFYKNRIILTGCIHDDSREPLDNVSIYIDDKLYSKTDTDGYYKILLRKRFQNSVIHFVKQGFKEVLFDLKKNGKKDFYLFFENMKEKKLSN